MWIQAKKDNDDTVPSFFDADGHIMKPSDLNDEQKAALDRWLSDDKVIAVIGPTLNDYKVAILGEIKDR